MDKQERMKIYKEAEDIWGLTAQYDQAIEEMGELIVAINKYKRKYFAGEYKGNNSIEENLAEEIADVKMCLEQLESYVGEEKISMVFEKKLEELANLIEFMKEERNDK